MSSRWAGVIIGQVTGITPALPRLDIGLHLPHLLLPARAQLLHGIEYAVLPQIPLTLTNAIIVTAIVVRQHFSNESHRVNERNLAVSTGLGNLLAAPFGGFLMCHGAGGIMGHHRFGARSATAPLLIGITFLVLGLLLGKSGYDLLRTIPDAVLGGLLLFSGIELALSSKPHEYKGADLFLVLLMAAIGVAANAAVAFAAKVNQNRGEVTGDDIKTVKAAGYSDAQIVEIVALVAENVFTNYLNKVAETDIDFPIVRTEALSERGG